MSIELIKSDPKPEQQRRVMRLMLDVRKLLGLSKAEIKAVYRELEAARDALSRILDRVDGKQ